MVASRLAMFSGGLGLLLIMGCAQPKPLSWALDQTAAGAAERLAGKGIRVLVGQIDSDIPSGAEQTQLGQDISREFGMRLYEATQATGLKLVDPEQTAIARSVYEQVRWESRYRTGLFARLDAATVADVVVVGQLNRGEKTYNLRIIGLDVASDKPIFEADFDFDRSPDVDPRFRPPISVAQTARAAQQSTQGAGDSVYETLRKSATEIVKKLAPDLNKYPDIKIAVGSLDGLVSGEPGVVSRYGYQLTNLIEAELKNQCKVKLCERRNLAKVLKMQAVEWSSPVFSEETLSPLNQAEGVEAVLYGSLEPVGKEVSATVALATMKEKRIIGPVTHIIPYAYGQDDLKRRLEGQEPLRVKLSMMQLRQGSHFVFDYWRSDAALSSDQSYWFVFQGMGERCYVYLWQFDSQGRWFALWPSREDPNPDNIVPEAGSLFVPARRAFRLNPEAGIENVRIVVSRDRKEDLHRLLASLDNSNGVSDGSPEAQQLRQHNDDAGLRGPAGTVAIPSYVQQASASLRPHATVTSKDSEVLSAGPAIPDQIIYQLSFRNLGAEE